MVFIASYPLQIRTAHPQNPSSPAGLATDAAGAPDSFCATTQREIRDSLFVLRGTTPLSLWQRNFETAWRNLLTCPLAGADAEEAITDLKLIFQDPNSEPEKRRLAFRLYGQILQTLPAHSEVLRREFGFLRETEQGNSLPDFLRQETIFVLTQQFLRTSLLTPADSESFSYHLLTQLQTYWVNPQNTVQVRQEALQLYGKLLERNSTILNQPILDQNFLAGARALVGLLSDTQAPAPLSEEAARIFFFFTENLPPHHPAGHLLGIEIQRILRGSLRVAGASLSELILVDNLFNEGNDFSEGFRSQGLQQLEQIWANREFPLGVRFLALSVWGQKIDRLAPTQNLIALERLRSILNEERLPWLFRFMAFREIGHLNLENEFTRHPASFSILESQGARLLEQVPRDQFLAGKVLDAYTRFMSSHLPRNPTQFEMWRGRRALLLFTRRFGEVPELRVQALNLWASFTRTEDWLNPIDGNFHAHLSVFRAEAQETLRYLQVVEDVVSRVSPSDRDFEGVWRLYQRTLHRCYFFYSRFFPRTTVDGLDQAGIERFPELNDFQRAFARGIHFMQSLLSPERLGQDGIRLWIAAFNEFTPRTLGVENVEYFWNASMNPGLPAEWRNALLSAYGTALRRWHGLIPLGAGLVIGSIDRLEEGSSLRMGFENLGGRVITEEDPEILFTSMEEYEELFRFTERDLEVPHWRLVHQRSVQVSNDSHASYELRVRAALLRSHFFLKYPRALDLAEKIQQVHLFSELIEHSPFDISSELYGELVRRTNGFYGDFPEGSPELERLSTVLENETRRRFQDSECLTALIENYCFQASLTDIGSPQRLRAIRFLESLAPNGYIRSKIEELRVRP